MQLHRLLSVGLLACLVVQAQAELSVPSSTAYLVPQAERGRGFGRRGSLSLNDPAQKALWFVHIKAPGKLECSVALKLSTNAETKLRLTVAGKSLDATAKGAGDTTVNVKFGSFDIATAGYQRFTLESLNPPGQSAGDITALLLDGPAAQDAVCVRTPAQRGAPSVHLSYPVPREEKVDAFYCEVTAVEDPVPTYYMACGWHRGYFGMQVNSPTERRIIFSVWDSGSEHNSRENVGEADRVTLVAKGDGVFSGDFGNEGTGGHSHLVYDWKTGTKQRFIVTDQVVDATHSIYSGYWFHPEQKQWMLISSWKAPKDGSYLRGLYSFDEDFGGTGLLRRKALFGNQWARTADGRWLELTTARFSHTGKNERLDRCMGVEGGQFFLAAGAFLDGTTETGERLTRPAIGKAPTDVILPPLPQK